MQSITPSTGRAQAAQLAPSQQARCQQRPAVAASLARPATLKQQIRRDVPAQRRMSASRAAGRSTAVSVVARAGGDVLVVGSSGQTAARVVINLLRTGFKVTAGVDTDLEESQEVVKFAKSLELINAGEASNLKLAEFNPLDAEAIAGVLKRGSRVVLVVGDQAGNRRPDLKIYDAVLEALLENADRISQLVVVSPLAGGGTMIFGGGRGGGAGRLSRLEQTVVDSGVDYLIVRAAPSDRVTDRYGEQANIVVAPAGGLPSGLQASRSQVAATVAAAMAQARGDAIIEVGASAEYEYTDLASRVAAALAGAELEEEEEVEEEEEEAEEETPKKVGFFTIGSRKKAAPVVVEEEEEEEEEEAPAPAKKGGFFSFGGSKKKAAPAPVEEEEEEEEEEEPAPAPAKRGGFSFGAFGTRKIVRQPVVEEEEEEEEEAPAPAPAKRGFSFGTRRITKQQAVVEEEEAEEEEPAPPKRGGFRFGSSRKQAAAAEEEETPTVRIQRGRNPLPSPEKERAAARPAAAQQSEEAATPAKKQGGFLGFLGISQETVYADE